jgi:hypothetical protein
MLENGLKAMLVETKNKPTTEDVKEYVERLEKMRCYADLHGDNRQFLGAEAGVVMTNNVRQHILNRAFLRLSRPEKLLTLLYRKANRVNGNQLIILRQLQNFSFQLTSYQGSVLEAFRRTKLRSCCKTPISFATGSFIYIFTLFC